MAYGKKFELVFSDVSSNPRKIEILKKDYTGSVKSLVGTDDPVRIKWDTNDDIYSPIIGSTCEISLFVTDDTDYDDWYDADEREYKVRILTGDISGSPVWNTTEDGWAEASIEWDDGTGQGFEFYWEGYLVVDRYREAVLTKPFPIRLIASDGLGTLNGYEAPNSNVILSGGQPDINASQSNFDSLFYYIRKILENTGLDFDIYIANNIRAATGAVNETLFHDIQAYEFGLRKNNFKNFNAKELLEKILKITNSRIFQANGRWYIISNSNLIDTRIFSSIPVVEDLSFTVLKNSTGNNFTLIGNDPAGNALTFAISTDVSNGTTSLSTKTVTYAPTTDYVGEDFFLYTASNTSNTSDAGRVNIEVVEQTTSIAPQFPQAAPFAFLYRGDTVQQTLSRVRSWINYYTKTHPNEMSNYGNQGATRTFLAYGASAFNSLDEKTWRYAGVGAGVLAFDVRYNLFKDDAETNPNYSQVYPQVADATNFAYDVVDGFYGFSTQSLVTSRFSQGRTFAGVTRRYFHDEVDDSLRNALENGTQFPFATSTRDEISHNLIIIIIRVVNNKIVERYEFAR
jgi:hypothetical protein